MNGWREIGGSTRDVAAHRRRRAVRGWMMKEAALLVLAALFMTALAVVPAAAQTCRQDSTPPNDHWAFDAIAELAAKGIIEGYPGGTSDRAMTRDGMTMIIARPGRDAIAGEIFDLLLGSPNAVDTNGDGKKDTYVAKIAGKWFGVVDVDDDGRVDYVWEDKNDDGIPQSSELSKLNRDCWEAVPVPVRPQQPSQGPRDIPKKEPAEKGTHEPGR